MDNNPNGNVIFYIGHYQLPHIDALSHRVMANCVALREAGFKVVIIGFCKDKSTSKNIFDTHFISEGFDCYNIPYPISNADWVRNMTTYKSINKLIESYFVEGVHSIVVTNNLGATNYLGLLNFTKKHNIKTVSDTEDWFDIFAGNFLRRTYKKYDEKFTVEYIKPKMKNIITISTFLYDYYTKKNCNCLIVPALTYEEDARFKTLPQRENDGVLRYVYSGSPGYKGAKDRIDWCVKAFLDNAPVHAKFDIYGISLEDFTQQFPEHEKCKKDERITFHGFCDNKVCVEAIAKADYSVFARVVTLYTTAGFPSKFSECLAMGVPTVTTPTSDLKDYIENGVTGFISDDTTYESFEKAFIQSCKVTREEINKIHENCKNCKKLDSSTYVEPLKEYFNSLK